MKKIIFIGFLLIASVGFAQNTDHYQQVGEARRIVDKAKNEQGKLLPLITATNTEATRDLLMIIIEQNAQIIELLKKSK